MRPLALALALIGAACPEARAVDASEYLISPIVTKGERELDWQFGAGSPGTRTHSEANSGIGLGWGVNDHWATEFSIDYHKLSTGNTKPDELEWENVAALADQGEWPVDVGLAFDLSKSITGSGGLSLRFGPLFQKDFGRFLGSFNLLFMRRFGHLKPTGTELRYQAQIEYRYSRPLDFGIQAFGRFGADGHFRVGSSRQVHRLGPVVLGSFTLTHGRSISYNAAWLVGTTGASPDSSVRLQLEYEF
ncbi:MAG: hypothetical protein KGL43_27260 [Burkholderiales bacterium]|nr:hypothetical protein [Burkholderiales bacterium]MDE2457308.1 hypothetical protein [Burkholderiales bacterium]